MIKLPTRSDRPQRWTSLSKNDRTLLVFLPSAVVGVSIDFDEIAKSRQLDCHVTSVSAADGKLVSRENRSVLRQNRLSDANP